MKYDKILVAYDGSLSAANALDQALWIAGKTGASLEIISVYTPYAGDYEFVVTPDMERSLREPAERALEEAASKVAAAGVKAVKTLQEGRPYEAIIEAAEKSGANLIVMGRRGFTRLERMLMGSVTSRVIGFSKAPVLVVPRGTALSAESALVATDCSDCSDPAVEHSLWYCSTTGARLLGITVAEIDVEFSSPKLVEAFEKKAVGYFEDLKARASSRNVAFESMIRAGDPYTMIVNIAGERKPGVIFMGSHGRRGIKKFFYGSVVEKVIGHAPAPVLVVKTC